MNFSVHFNCLGTCSAYTLCSVSDRIPFLHVFTFFGSIHRMNGISSIIIFFLHFSINFVILLMIYRLTYQREGERERKALKHLDFPFWVDSSHIFSRIIIWSISSIVLNHLRDKEKKRQCKIKNSMWHSNKPRANKTHKILDDTRFIKFNFNTMRNCFAPIRWSDEKIHFKWIDVHRKYMFNTYIWTLNAQRWEANQNCTIQKRRGKKNTDKYTSHKIQWL